MYKGGKRSSSSSKTRKGLTLVEQARKKKILYLDVNTFRALRPGRKGGMRPKKKRPKKKEKRITKDANCMVGDVLGYLLASSAL